MKAADLPSNVIVNTEDELVKALADATIQSVDIGSDIEISNSTSLEIKGDNKFINGNSHVLHLMNGASITSNVRIKGINDVIISSNYNVNLLFKYGGTIEV